METVFIKEENFEKSRKRIRENRGKEIIFTSGDDEISRKVLEKEKVNVLLIKQKSRRDFARQRNSGFNQVMAKEARKSGVSIGIFLDEILESKGKEKGEILARTKQNIALCGKNKVKMRFVSLTCKNQRNSRDLRALGLVLGMPTWMTKNL